MATSTTREVYANTEDVVAMLAAYNVLEGHILALAEQLGDKAPLDLLHAKACVKARRQHAYETYNAREQEFGSPFSDYRVVRPPQRLISRYRRWLYERIEATRIPHARS